MFPTKSKRYLRKVKKRKLEIIVKKKLEETRNKINAAMRVLNYCSGQ